MLGEIFYYLIIFIAWMLLMYQTGVFAKQKGYNQKWAILMGALFSIIAFIFYWSFPKKK